MIKICKIIFYLARANLNLLLSESTLKLLTEDETLRKLRKVLPLPITKTCLSAFVKIEGFDQKGSFKSVSDSVPLKKCLWNP